MKLMNVVRKYGPRVAIPAALSVPLFSHAALDAAVTTGITTAQTDLLALMSALTGAGIAVFVARVIYNHFRVR